MSFFPALRLSVCPLLTVFCLLFCTAGAVCAGDIFLFLSLGLHLPVVGFFLWGAFEGYSVLYYFLEIVHIVKSKKVFGGKGKMIYKKGKGEKARRQERTFVG